MKIHLRYFFVGFLTLFLATDLFAQDTLSQIRPTDTTFIQKALRRYNKLNYIFYGRFTQGIHSKSDTNYIKSYPDYIVVSGGYITPYLSYSITPLNNTTAKRTNYVAKVSSVLGFRCSYKNISFAYSFKLKSGLDNVDQYTQTTYNSFSLKFQNNKLNQSFTLSHVKGLTDIGQYPNSTKEVEYIKRDDIEITDFKYELIWNFNWKKYSYVAPRTYGQRQLKSRLGFMMKSGIVINSFKGDSSITNNTGYQSAYNFKTIQEIDGILFQLAPGIGGNFVISKCFYLSSTLFIGPNYYDYKYKRQFDSEMYHSSSFQVLVDGEMGFGYQTERFFTGLLIDWKSINEKVNDATIFLYNASAGIHIGYRLNTPKIISKSYKILFPY